VTLSLVFHGGAGTVTGSRFEVEADGTRILVDCGLFQGLKWMRDLNWRRPAFNPREIDAVLLTHAHIDHSGYLPRLVREGFRGTIYCTPPTLELIELLLVDAAKLQEEDADYANRKGFSKHHPAIPLFTVDDARAALRRVRTVPFGSELKLGPMSARFHQAGHILGSAFIELSVDTSRERTSMVFSGDVGRVAQPLHPDPESLPACDTLLLESTYGDRSHDQASFSQQLAKAIREAIARRGVVLIPAFAVARAQIVTLLLEGMIESGAIPAVPIDIDSPMAIDVTQIYAHAAGTSLLDPLPRGRSRLFPRNLRFHRTVEESKALNAAPGPRIIISASGMLTGGRVLHHLARLLPNRRNLVVLVGYQAEGTRGRALIDGAATIRIHGQDVPVRAQFIEAHGLSAHADRDELVEWVASAAAPPKTTFLVHGEASGQAGLAEKLRERRLHVVVPRLGERFAYEPASRRWKSAGMARPEGG
jgi:metallo-beta-lactamase family protein